MNPLFHVVLVEPEIPQNTGNIGRTCVGLNSKLHLIGKLGFEINNKRLRRAGLDYWDDLEYEHHQSWTDWQKKIKDPLRIFYCSTKANNLYFNKKYQKGNYFVFGKETKGLDEDLLKQNDAQAIKIPMPGPIRSLNLATSVSIILFEAFRQIHELDLK